MNRYTLLVLLTVAVGLVAWQLVRDVQHTEAQPDEKSTYLTGWPVSANSSYADRLQFLREQWTDIDVALHDPLLDLQEWEEITYQAKLVQRIWDDLSDEQPTEEILPLANRATFADRRDELTLVLNEFLPSLDAAQQEEAATAAEPVSLALRRFLETLRLPDPTYIQG